MMDTTTDGGVSSNSDANSQSLIPLPELLLEGKDDIDAKNEHDFTALMSACNRRDKNISKAISLIKHGASLDVRTQYEKTALIFACQSEGFQEVVDLMIERGVDINAADDGGSSALYYACLLEDPSSAISLIEAGANLDAKGYEGKTAFMIACGFGSDEVVDVILKKGVDLNDTDEYGSTALMIACESGMESIAITLINHGATWSMKKPGGCTPLMEACSNDCENLVKLMLEKGVDIDDRDCEGLSALHYAFYSDTEMEIIVKMLIDYGFDVNAQTQEGKTCIMLLVDSPHRYPHFPHITPFIKMLLDAGANFDLVDKTGKSIVTMVQSIQCEECVQALIDHNILK